VAINLSVYYVLIIPSIIINVIIKRLFHFVTFPISLLVLPFYPCILYSRSILLYQITPARISVVAIIYTSHSRNDTSVIAENRESIGGSFARKDHEHRDDDGGARTSADGSTIASASASASAFCDGNSVGVGLRRRVRAGQLRVAALRVGVAGIVRETGRQWWPRHRVSACNRHIGRTPDDSSSRVVEL
jgi:hypothetical protein